MSVFGDLLLWLADQQDADVRDPVVDDRVHDAVAGHPPVTSKQLQGALLSGSSGGLDGRTPRPVIVLPKADRADPVLACLTPRFARHESFTELRLYVAIYYWDESWETVDAMGFRYEQPEGSSDAQVGTHDYWHVQPTPDVAEGTDAALNLRTHPSSTPAFPLEARDADELLVCLLISIYGARYADRLRLSGVPGIDGVLDRLACTRPADRSG